MAFSDYSAFDEFVFLLQQPFALDFCAAFAIVHLLHPMFFFRTNTILCRNGNFIPYFFMTALMRRIPALLLSSLIILKLAKSAVFFAWGPPQISIETSPI